MNKKKVITAAAVLTAVGVLVGFTAGGPKQNTGTGVRTYTLERGDLVSAVSATGTVYSQESTNVYSNLNYPVKEIYVSVGDTVEAGDILAVLDTASLEADISQKQASVSSSQATARQNLANAQSDLEVYQYNSQNNYDTNLLNAQSSVTTSEMELQSAELDLQSANADLSSARRKYREAKDGDSDIDYTDQEIDSLRDTVVQKEITQEKAQTNLEKAQANLEKAKNNLTAAQASNNDTITTYENKVKSAQLSTNVNDQLIAIDKLQNDLANATITAPVSGTITSIPATVGASGNGLLFVMQDTSSLKIVANIKEYDIDTVTVGNKVTIKSDATGNKVFDGILTKIAPTSTLSAKGENTGSTDAEYESEIAVTSAQSGLRIGMNTRLSIITEDRANVYSVPYEALVATPDGNPAVYIAQPQEDGAYKVALIPVTVGLEADLYVEVDADELTDGSLVIRDTQGLSEGGAVTLRTGNATKEVSR